MGRAPCCDKTKVKRGPWSPDEDNILKNYLDKNGTGGNWISLPQKSGLRRCGKSCRLRWLNYLRPDIKHGGFTEEEDNIILTLYSQIGSRWSVIAANLQGRTDNDVKNHWNTKLKKKFLEAQNSYNNNSFTNNIDSSHDFNHNCSRNYYGILEATTCSIVDSNTFTSHMDPNLTNSSFQFPLPALMEILTGDETDESSLLHEYNIEIDESFENEFRETNLILFNQRWELGRSQENNAISSAQEDGYFMDFSSGISSSYYDNLVNDFDFQEKFIGSDPNYSSSSSNSTLIQLQANNVADFDQSIKGFEN